jgi:hypothetical protein
MQNHTSDLAGLEALWAAHLQSGQEAMHHGRLGEAEQHFLDALALAEQLGSDDLRVADSLIQLAGVYFHHP